MGELGTSTQPISSFGIFLLDFFFGDRSLWTGPPPLLQWTSFPHLLTAVLITPKGAESPGSRRIGVIGALPSETV